MDQKAWLARVMDPANRIVTHPRYHGYQAIRLTCDLAGRTVPDHLMFLMLEGDGTLATRRKRFELKPGSFAWVPAGVFHRLLLNPGSARYTIRFRIEGAIPTVQPPEKNLFVEPHGWETQSYIEQLAEELRLNLPFRADRVRGLLYMLSIRFFRLQTGREERGGKRLSEAQCRRILAFASREVQRRPGPADLAHAAGLSPDYFGRLFRRTFGVAPRTWLVRERIHAAARDLTETAQTITEVAYSYGYPDVFLFSRQFKATIGVSPRTYIRRHQAKHDNP